MNGFFSCSDSGAHWNIAAIVPKRANTVGTQMGRSNGDGVEARNDGHVFCFYFVVVMQVEDADLIVLVCQSDRLPSDFYITGEVTKNTQLTAVFLQLDHKTTGLNGINQKNNKNSQIEAIVFRHI